MNNTDQGSSESIRRVIDKAAFGLVDRETLIELVVLGAVASEHLLVIGPPGTAEGRQILFFRPEQTTEPVAQLDLAGARSAGIRRYANTFCMVDDCGRLMVMSLEDFRIVRDARV